MKTRVSARALLARVNRRLFHEDQILRRSRETSRFFYDLGEYYILDLSRNLILEKHVDLAELAQLRGVIAKSERLAD